MKSLVANMTKIEKEASKPNEEWSAFIPTDTPPKLGDLGSFTIPCSIYKKFTCEALADLGVAINLMPLSICRKVRIKELNATWLLVQRADSSCNAPIGIVEDVPVKVGNFIFPTDFVVLDVPEDSKYP